MTKKNKRIRKSMMDGFLDGLIGSASICAVQVPASDFFGGADKNKRLSVRAKRINKRSHAIRLSANVQTKPAG